MAAITSFHAEKCSDLVVECTQSVCPAAAPGSLNPHLFPRPMLVSELLAYKIVNMVWRQRTSVTNYVDQQALNLSQTTTTFCLINDSGCSTYSSVHCRDRMFPVAAARLWNSLLSHITAVPSLHLLLSS